MNAEPAARRQPPIVLCESDHDALERAALDAILERPRVAGALLDEVDRACVVADRELADDLVRLGSLVRFSDSLTGEVRSVRLSADPAPRGASGELAALSSIGAALVGLRVGQSIRWSDRIGPERVLTVVAVGVAA